MSKGRVKLLFSLGDSYLFRTGSKGPDACSARPPDPMSSGAWSLERVCVAPPCLPGQGRLGPLPDPPLSVPSWSPGSPSLSGPVFTVCELATWESRIGSFLPSRDPERRLDLTAGPRQAVRNVALCP